MRRFVISAISLLNFFLCIGQNAYSPKGVQGRIVDTEENPIVGAYCILYNPSDSTQIAGAVTNIDGFFDLKVGESKEYLLRISCIGYKELNLICRLGDLGHVVLKEEALTLEDVVVTPQLLNSFGNKEQLILSESAKKIGNNALDAIGSLPQFKTDASGINLVTVDNKSMLVLIDGIRRNAYDLMLLKTDDINTILFYSNPPARYAHENIGAVIDVTTKKKTDKVYSIYIDTKNSVTTGYGTDLLSVAYVDSLNMLSAAYFIDYRSLNNNQMDNTYAYSDMINEYYGISGKYEGRYHIGQVTYQRYQGNNLFNAKLEYRAFPGEQKYTQKKNGSNEPTLTNTRELASKYTSASADLYYMYMFNQQKSLSFNVVNTYYLSNSDNTLSSGTGQYSFNDHIDNKSYSLIAETLFSDKLWNGIFNLGAFYQFKTLEQEYYHSDNATIKTHKEYFYTDFSQAAGIFSYNVGIGLENNCYNTATNQTYNYLVFRPTVTLDLNCNKHSVVRLTSSVNSSIPNVGDLTNSIATIDEFFYIQGNDNLKPYYYYFTNLNYKYASEGGKIYLVPDFSYSYYPNKNMPILLSEEGYIIQRITRIKDIHTFQATLSLSYRALDWLSVQPFYNYEYLQYQTPNQSIRHNLNNAGISIRLLPKNWQFVWNANFPVTSVNGDIFTKQGFNMVASVLYKHKSMSVGLEVIHNPNPAKSYANINGFSYSEDTKWNNFKNLVAVKFSYYLYRGKSRAHLGKRISNIDNDSGLTHANTAK